METLVKIEKQLTCSLCSDLYQRPKIIPCYHSFCESCISKELSTDGLFKCNQCQKDVVISIPVDTLPSNFLIEALLDILSLREKNVHSCDLCDEEMIDPATSYCKNCGKFLCVHHVFNHYKTKVTKEHKVVPIHEDVRRHVSRPPLEQVNGELETIDEDKTPERDSENESKSNFDPSQPLPSICDMVKHALRDLGGKRSSTEITAFMSKNYADVLKRKAKTWKNSVVGVLCSNPHIFAREQIGNRKYLWFLNPNKGKANPKGKAKKNKKRKKSDNEDDQTQEEEYSDNEMTEEDEERRTLETLLLIPRQHERRLYPTQSTSSDLLDNLTQLAEKAEELKLREQT